MKRRHDSLSFANARVESGMASGVTYLDVAINGQPLSEIATFAHRRADTRSPTSSEVGVFGPWPSAELRSVARQLLLRTQPARERVPLYRCPCGDWECGGASVRVTAYDDCYTWTDFGPPPDGQDPIVREFAFEKVAYEAVLSSRA